MFSRPYWEPPPTQRPDYVLRVHRKLSEQGLWLPFVSINNWLRHHPPNPRDIVPGLPTSEWSAPTPFPVHVTERREPRSPPRSPILRPGNLFAETPPGEADPEFQVPRGATGGEADSTLIVDSFRWVLSVAIDRPSQEDVNLSNRLREYLGRSPSPCSSHAILRSFCLHDFLSAS
jgi:hypothetical protein